MTDGFDFFESVYVNNLSADISFPPSLEPVCASKLKRKPANTGTLGNEIGDPLSPKMDEDVEFADDELNANGEKHGKKEPENMANSSAVVSTVRRSRTKKRHLKDSKNLDKLFPLSKFEEATKSHHINTTHRLRRSLVANDTEAALRVAEMKGADRVARDAQIADLVIDEESLVRLLIPGSAMYRDGERPKQGPGRKSLREFRSPEVADLMGEANMLFAERNYMEAVPLIQEVIRRSPHSPDPYLALGLIFEETGELKKAVEAYILAGYFHGKDSSHWRRAGELSLKAELWNHALYCFSRFCRIEKKNAAGWYQKFLLQEKLRDLRAIDSLREYVALEPGDSKSMIELVRRLYKKEDFRGAVNVLEEAREFLGKSFSVEMWCMLAQAGIAAGDAQHIVDIVEERQEDTHAEICVDLRVRYAIACALVGKMQNAVPVIEDLMAMDVSLYHDLYYDAVECCMDPRVRFWPGAIALLERLLTNVPVQDSMQYIPWVLKLADAFRENNNLGEAIQTLIQAIHMIDGISDQVADRSSAVLTKLSVTRSEAVLGLSTLHRMTGNDLLAKLVLDVPRMLENRPLNDTLLEMSERFVSRDVDEFLMTALPLVLHCLGQEEITSKRKKKRKRTTEAELTGSLLRRAHLVALTCMVLEALSYQDRYAEAINVVNVAANRVLFVNDLSAESALHLISLGLFFRSGEFDRARSEARWLVMNDASRLVYWNCWYRMCALSRAEKLFGKVVVDRESLVFKLIAGHSAFGGGFFSEALGFYGEALKLRANDPWLLFLTGLTYYNAAVLKGKGKKFEEVALAFFIKYFELSGRSDIRACYNLGRAFQGLRLTSLALFFYRRVMAFDIPTEEDSDVGSEEGSRRERERVAFPTDPYKTLLFLIYREQFETGTQLTQEKRTEILRVQRSAAYNMSLIYTLGGSIELAREILHSTIVV